MLLDTARVLRFPLSDYFLMCASPVASDDRIWALLQAMRMSPRFYRIRFKYRLLNVMQGSLYPF